MSAVPVTLGQEFAAWARQVELSGVLNVIAASLTRLDNNVRQLGAGWRIGLAELIVPTDRLPNSTMPRKIDLTETNPTQCEALAMVAAQAMGNHVTVMIAAAPSSPELNDPDMLRPVTTHNVLQSCQLLANAVRGFAV